MDIFNIFGGSKKKVSRGNRENETEQSQQPQQQQQSSEGNFVFVAQDHNPAYYASGQTILTNENIRGMGSSASVPENDNQIYPSLDISKAQPAESLNSSSFELPHSTITRTTTIRRHISPMDNIPFAFQTPGLGGSSRGDDSSIRLHDFDEISQTLYRVESFVKSSGFHYNFQLESSIIRQNVYE